MIPGITAKAKVVLAEAKDTFVVPVSALVQDSSGALSLLLLYRMGRFILSR